MIERKKTNPKIVVVVSAMGDTTDDYISLAKEITDTPDKRELDVLMSTGEMISASLLAIVVIFSVVATELPPYFCTIISPIIFPP